MPGHKWVGTYVFVIPFWPLYYLKGIENTLLTMRLAGILSNFTFSQCNTKI